ncbi:hypothetical protein Hypma_004578 [Hypsizygus marmoreus]|uniref:Uncharacterized protein n=1 Tax=Hypsizygus marmoreus TaxID=39966 RepID=A0A369K3C8_HYPMA|nr:hypothetical protein Hypma_004578 [Hypsizygus marmoreus]
MLGIWVSPLGLSCSVFRKAFFRRTRGTGVIQRWDGYATRSAAKITVPEGHHPDQVYRRPKRMITTLRPENLSKSDCIDISHVEAATIRVPVGVGFAPSVFYYTKGANNINTPFPENTRGFLYYHHEPGYPPAAGAIRFRLTSDDNPSSFMAGKDLLDTRGLPWCIPLLRIPRPKYIAFRYQLLQDGLITESLWERCKTLSKNHRSSQRTFYGALHFLEQPFFLDISSSNFTATIVTEDLVEVARFHFAVKWEKGQQFQPYKGCCMARLERSTLAEHMGKNILVIRILEILKPLESTIGDNEDVKLLSVGSLLRFGNRLVTVDLDRDAKNASKLRLLLPSSTS